jgi:hypothetical protein
MQKGLVISDIRHSTKVGIDQHHQCSNHWNEAKCSLEHSYKLKIAQNSWTKSTHRVGVNVCFFASFWVNVYFLFFENDVMLFCVNFFSFLHAKLLFLLMDFLNSLLNCFAHFFLKICKFPFVLACCNFLEITGKTRWYFSCWLWL